jgi:hypothetical protein
VNDHRRLGLFGERLGIGSTLAPRIAAVTLMPEVR